MIISPLEPRFLATGPMVIPPIPLSRSLQNYHDDYLTDHQEDNDLGDNHQDNHFTDRDNHHDKDLADHRQDIDCSDHHQDNT